MDPALRSRLERVYAAHPQSAENILKRLVDRDPALSPITERDLAEAPAGGVTDQNHFGGASATRAMAAAVGAQPSWNVLDIGAGLGGTLRLLAEEIGCRGHGIELTDSRYRDAISLTKLLRLDQRVTFSSGDFMTLAVPSGAYDLVICQSAVTHFKKLSPFLAKAVDALRPGGRLVLEDVCLSSRPAVGATRRELQRLMSVWNSSFGSSAQWVAILEASGCRCDDVTDITATAIADFDSALGGACLVGQAPVPKEEQEGWTLGRRLMRAGYLAVARVLATRMGNFSRAPQEHS